MFDFVVKQTPPQKLRPLKQSKLRKLCPKISMLQKSEGAKPSPAIIIKFKKQQKYAINIYFIQGIKT